MHVTSEICTSANADAPAPVLPGVTPLRRGTSLVRCLSLFAGIGLLMGCSGGTNYAPPAPSSVAEALQTLNQALDAWKSGDKPEALAKNPNGIFIGDEDWSQGQQLSNYEVLGEGETWGSAVRFRVKLQLVEKSTKEACYQVSTNPVRSVRREDAE